MNGPANGILWTSDEAAAATRGDTTRPFSATGVSIDSRTIVPGDLFVALKGPNFDGHGFVPRHWIGGRRRPWFMTRRTTLPKAPPC